MKQNCFVMKRSGERVPFNISKIIKAINGANEDEKSSSLERVSEQQAQDIANNIYQEALKLDRDLSVEEIQDRVEEGLMATGKYHVARSYITYRYNHNESRKMSDIDQKIANLIELNNEEVKQENSNKNPTILSVQRDYMAGEWSRYYTNKYLLPKDIVQAHKDGLIHFHDADYFAQHMHNCLDVNTTFITDKGVRSFKDFKDGDKITVLTKSGQWKSAIVHNYGKDKLYRYTFYNGKKNNIKEILATENHRWYLIDGSITTNLKLGDRLAKAPVIYHQDLDFDSLTNEEKLLWCKGFALGDGTVENRNKDYNLSTRIRLCGEKNQYLSRFNIPGCTIRSQTFGNGDKVVAISHYQKQVPEFNNPKEVQIFLNGLYCADGRMKINNPHSRTYRIQSSHKEVIDFIREYAPVGGLYITKESDLSGQSTNYTSSRKYTILFSFNPNFSFAYKVLNKEFVKEDDVWCLEVEDEHNFVLSSGIVTGNCDLINLDDMLQNGTCISGTHIDRPHSFLTACTVTSQIVAQVASSQYGGQTFTLSHLAPFVEESRKKISARLKEEFNSLSIEISEDQFKNLVEQEVKKEVEAGCQTIQYQLITLQSTNGQAPFVTVFMYLHEVPEGQLRKDLALIIEVMFRQRILGVKDRTGVYITPAFPKLIYVLQEDNIDKGTPYFYLTELAAKCTAKRMVPDYISEKKMLELKGDCYPCMGCRSFLTVDRFTDTGKWNNKESAENSTKAHKYYGRFNQGVCTINLVDAACSSNKDESEFWKIMNDRLELCHRALQERHKRLLGTPSDVAPILWQDGALARLKPGEVIDPLLYDGYSTISLGYAGLAECVYYMKGVSHTSEEGRKFGLAVMQLLNDKCNEWKAAENIDYSVYGTPLESTTYKFAKCLQKRFGLIPNVTDHNYITNSYHISVREEIDAFTKLTEESAFQELSPGGAISYVEVPNLQSNIPAVLAILKHIYNTIVYAELNTKSDLCEVCGYDGEIQIKQDDSGKLIWECPKCGNRDQSKMHVTRRTCGYIGTQFWNQGRTQEIKDRVLHVSMGTFDSGHKKK